ERRSSKADAVGRDRGGDGLGDGSFQNDGRADLAAAFEVERVGRVHERLLLVVREVAADDDGEVEVEVEVEVGRDLHPRRPGLTARDRAEHPYLDQVVAELGGEVVDGAVEAITFGLGQEREHHRGTTPRATKVSRLRTSLVMGSVPSRVRAGQVTFGLDT